MLLRIVEIIAHSDQFCHLVCCDILLWDLSRPGIIRWPPTRRLSAFPQPGIPNSSNVLVHSIATSSFLWEFFVIVATQLLREWRKGGPDAVNPRWGSTAALGGLLPWVLRVIFLHVITTIFWIRVPFLIWFIILVWVKLSSITWQRAGCPKTCNSPSLVAYTKAAPIPWSFRKKRTLFFLAVTCLLYSLAPRGTHGQTMVMLAKEWNWPVLDLISIIQLRSTVLEATHTVLKYDYTFWPTSITLAFLCKTERYRHQ